jgi:hypothetical protein
VKKGSRNTSIKMMPIGSSYASIWCAQVTLGDTGLFMFGHRRRMKNKTANGWVEGYTN